MNSGEPGNEPKLCWGNCGCWLYFQVVSNRGPRRVVAFQIETGRPHSCPRPAKAPRVFVPAMVEFSESRKCECGEMVYEVPVRGGHYRKEIIQFNRIEWPWVEHDCEKYPTLPGILDFSLRKLSDNCTGFNLPKPYKLVIVVCQKRILGQPQEYVVALKSVSGERFCCRLIGEGGIRWGDFQCFVELIMTAAF